MKAWEIYNSTHNQSKNQNLFNFISKSNSNSIIQRADRNFLNVRNASSAPAIYRLVEHFQQQEDARNLPRSEIYRAVRNGESISRLKICENISKLPTGCVLD